MAQYALLVYGEEAVYEAGGDELTMSVMAGHQKFAENNGGAILGGNELSSVTTATTIRQLTEGEFTVTDGPFLETKEALGGLYVIEAESLDEAIAMGKQIPMPGGCIEVRPIMVR